MRAKILYCIIILTSIFACKKEVINGRYKSVAQIKVAPGPEDIVLDKNNNRILVSCNERRDGRPSLGEIYQIDINTDETKVITRINFPAIPFNPHGFDLQTINGVSYLYVINHYRDAASTSSVIQFKINTTNLEFIKEYKNALLISPNDLTVLPNGSFYFSNDKNSSNILDLLTNPNAGSVVYCDGNDTWKKVDSLIGFPNGLYNENNTLYLATSRNHALYRYTINIDGTLQNKSTLSTINGMDNITNAGDELIISVHPDEVKFALLSYIPTTVSPSITYAIDKQTGSAHILFKDDGKVISGSSTALINGDDLYLAQVFGDFVLKVHNY